MLRKENMSNLEHIKQKLKIKERGLTESHQIITPESGIPSGTQAKWMIDLLQFMYIEHGIAKSPDKVVSSIESGECRCWFILEDDQPVALAALVTQSDGSVELGRAVAITPGLGLGSIAMLRAGIDQLEKSDSPLVAEVRVADDFLGVPSGGATQNILLKQFGLSPHALVPMFNHGDPIRQEMFALSTSQGIQEGEPIFLSEDKKGVEKLQASISLSRKIFKTQVQVEQGQINNTGFELVQKEPFSLVIPSDRGSKLEMVTRAGLESSNFILLPLEMNPKNTLLILDSLEAGWIPCGVDRNLGQSLHPVLLLGKLKQGTLLAPIDITQENLTLETASALEKVDKLFRKDT